MKYLFLLLPLSLNAQYKITANKLIGWSTYAVSGMVWGAREKYHSDPRIFEKKWGVNEYSFWGSKAWERNYIGDRYLNPITDLPNKHKSELLGNFGRDFWHTSGYISGAFVLTGTFMIGNSKQKFKHKLFDLLIGSGIFLISSNLTYRL